MSINSRLVPPLPRLLPPIMCACHSFPSYGYCAVRRTCRNSPRSRPVRAGLTGHRCTSSASSAAARRPAIPARRRKKEKRKREKKKEKKKSEREEKEKEKPRVPVRRRGCSLPGSSPATQVRCADPACAVLRAPARPSARDRHYLYSTGPSRCTLEV